MREGETHRLVGTGGERQTGVEAGDESGVHGESGSSVVNPEAIFIASPVLLARLELRAQAAAWSGSRPAMPREVLG